MSALSRLPLILGSLLLVACAGESKHDIYMEALKIEGEASRGVCKLHFGDGQTMQAISGDRVQECLHEVEAALVLYDKAAAMGMDEPDFKSNHARAKERKAHQEQMLTQIRTMEREQTSAQ